MLGDWIARFPGRRVLVVGDVMLDHFIHGSVSRISPEAPVPVVRFEREHFRLGGAANVAHNLRAYGAEVNLVGLIGRDEAAGRLETALQTEGIETTHLVRCPTRRTTCKTRIVTSRNQQVGRLDYEEDSDIGGELEAQVIEKVGTLTRSADAVVVSDYLKGTVTTRVMQSLIATLAPLGRPVLVDPKIPHIDCYAGATLITPNTLEAEAATAVRIRNDDDARAAAQAFRTRARCTSVLITRGEHGMWLLDGSKTRTPADVELALPAVAREVADVTGAGDTVIATIALATAAGAPLDAAARLANYAAGLSVAHFGPATVSREDLAAVATD
ncbi:MAG: D-glycero-beta-D-manno-heptose-7-phosphate kinase [Vicinamibacterales bacterium]